MGSLFSTSALPPPAALPAGALAPAQKGRAFRCGTMAPSPQPTSRQRPRAKAATRASRASRAASAVSTGR